MYIDDLKNLPLSPGVYIMYNAEDTVIYVGKSKSLKKRVSSYFMDSKQQLPKVAAMVSNVVRFEIIVTDTEFEALVLECSLIKQHMPRYNILLKDGKGYPCIRITFNDDFPKIELVRKAARDGAKYYGPFLSSMYVNETIDVIKRVFGVRTCNRVLPRDIGKHRPCLNYYIKQCKAPCDGKISQEDYRRIFYEIDDFLQGRSTDLVKQLSQKMMEYSEALEFEKAAALRDKLNAMRIINERQKIISLTESNIDVIATASNGTTLCVCILYIRAGAIKGKEQYFLNDGEVDQSELIGDFIKQHYFKENIPSSIHLSAPIDDMDILQQYLSEVAGSSIKLLTPQRGAKKSMVDMAYRNALESLQLRALKADRSLKKAETLLFEIRDTLGIPTVPYNIEAYDISHVAGAHCVGVCVAYHNAQKYKKGYRRFNVENNNDYHNMKEVLYRRIENAVNNDEKFLPLPDVILVDGGITQVNAAVEVCDFFKVNIPVFGMVKDDKHKTKGLINQNGELALNRAKPVFNFVAQVQDEVHRYAISSHKIKHSKTIGSELTKIKGIGDKKKDMLLKHFKSIGKIKKATLDELKQSGLDTRTAEAVVAYFNDVSE